LILFIWVISTAIISPAIRTRISATTIIGNWSIRIIRILPLTMTIFSESSPLIYWFLIVIGLFNLCRFVIFKRSNSIHSIYIELIHNLLISHLNSLHFCGIVISSLLFCHLLSFIFTSNFFLMSSHFFFYTCIYSSLFFICCLSFAFSLIMNFVFNLFSQHDRTK